MKRTHSPLPALLLCGAFAVSLHAQTAPERAIGLVSRVILDVTRRSPSVEWIKAERGDILDAGATLRTGEKSIAVIKLKDNSLLRIQEKCEVQLNAASQDGVFQKEATVGGGTVGFNIRRQRPGEEFRFVSPTSVASIRGTEGFFARGDSIDVFLILKGEGRIENRVSASTADVPAGFTAFSGRDGQLQVRKSTDREKKEAARASSLTEPVRRLKIPLKSPTGESRELILDLKE
jgi:hypothetical protein